MQQHKAAYVDFVENIAGSETTIRLYETPTHLFVYVSQPSTEVHLYNDFLQRILIQKCIRVRNKRIEVVCNLEKYETIDHIGNIISKIVNGYRQ